MPQCQARHGQKLYLQCEGEATEGTVHVGDHFATDRDGNTVRWSELVAMYPAIDSNFVANPSRVMVGEPGPELCQCGPGEHTLTGTCLPVGNGSARLSQVGGDHYRKFKIQPWDIIDEYDLSFYAGNALKYLLRAGRKGSKVEDLKKARHYLDRLIEIEEGE